MVNETLDFFGLTASFVGKLGRRTARKEGRKRREASELSSKRRQVS